MTSNDTNAGRRAGDRASDRAGAPGGRHSTGVVIGAALAGLALGALAVFAVAGITWKVRVELPPPPYPPQFSSTAPVGYPSPPPTSASTSGSLPVPPMPPGPPAPPRP